MASRLPNHAGRSPLTALAARVTNTDAVRTSASSRTSLTRGNPVGNSPGRKRCSQPASARPRLAPANPTRRLSTIHCRASRDTLAPSAVLSANSRRRCAARATCTLKTLAIAVTKSRATAPSNNSSPGRASRVATSRADATVTAISPSAPKSPSAARERSGVSWARAVASAEARETPTPGRRRASAPKIITVRIPSAPSTGITCMGSHSWTVGSGKANVGGITPITV